MQPPQQPPAPVQWQPPVVSGPAPGVRFAGLGARLIAYIIDGFIVTIVIIVVSLVFAAIAAAAFASNTTTDSSGAAVGAVVGGTVVYIVVIFLVSIAYFPWYWARGGQTPGMKMMHIRIVRDADGGPIDGGAAILRLIGLYVSGAVFYLGFIWVFVDKRRRGWHDLIAGTVVIESN